MSLEVNDHVSLQWSLSEFEPETTEKIKFFFIIAEKWYNAVIDRYRNLEYIFLERDMREITLHHIKCIVKIKLFLLLRSDVM